MNTITITLSPATKKMQAAVREILAEREKLRPKMASMLADDAKSLDTAAEALANLTAREQMIGARLPRRRAELCAALVVDAATMCERAAAEVARTLEARKKARDDFRERVFSENKKDTAQRLIADPALQPKSVQSAEREYADARELQRQAGVIRLAIDKAFAEVNAGTRAISLYGESYVKPLEHYYANAAQYVPELKD